MNVKSDGSQMEVRWKSDGSQMEVNKKSLFTFVNSAMCISLKALKLVILELAISDALNCVYEVTFLM